MKVVWNIYDRDSDMIFSTRNLPHWDQPGSITFVTMRLADSMPQEVVKLWHEEIVSWLVENGLAGRSVPDVLNDPRIKSELKRDLKRFKHRRWHGHLDDCHGLCPLRKPHLAQIAAESFLHFNGERYDLERFVVMPNHAHLLIQMRAGFKLRKQLTETMRFSGRKINKALGKAGEFWQSEPFDHIVRSEAQFCYLQEYILDNPSKAKLQTGEFIFWKHQQDSDTHDSESRAT